jgi:hypothetical protein
MSDFTYESDDISGVKVAFKNLHLQQPMAMTLGLVGSAAFFWGMMVINRRGGISFGAQKVQFACTPSLVAFSILPGAYVYGIELFVGMDDG